MVANLNDNWAPSINAELKQHRIFVDAFHFWIYVANGSGGGSRHDFLLIRIKHLPENKNEGVELPASKNNDIIDNEPVM